jgi:benzoylformate decarboxylase/acetolactate synthase-1/2/3 large subunit
MMYGSDLVIDFLVAAGIEYVALNPGATFRGLHDSLVHAQHPKPVIALHEEIAVGIAHGYAKSSGRPMATFIHNVVGLQHASMAIFNAWMDNVPILVIGGSGPRDTSTRRPWIDWVHSGMPQGLLVRDIVKWDDEPASLEAIPDSLARGLRIAQTAPKGPVYISIDAALQEEELGERIFSVRPLDDPTPMVPPVEVIDDIAQTLISADRPVVLVDRPGPDSSKPLRKLVDLLSAAVIDLGARCTFPSDHWADQTSDRRQALAEADLVLALEVRDLAWGISDLDMGTRRTKQLVQNNSKIISIGLTELQHRGFLSRETLVPEAHYVLSEVADFLKALLRRIDEEDLDGERIGARRQALQSRHTELRESARSQAQQASQSKPIEPAHLAACLWAAIGHEPWQLSNGLLEGWPRRLWHFQGEDSYLGRSGGEGLGYGLPASLGAALAQRDSDMLVVDIQADGDFLYTPEALWTAAHHHLPLLIVVHNNRSYGKDELHQTEMARVRGRSIDNVGIGIHIDHPAIDFAALAEAQGVQGVGPVEDPGILLETLQNAAQTVRTDRRPLLVDVICRR